MHVKNFAIEIVEFNICVFYFHLDAFFSYESSAFKAKYRLIAFKKQNY